MPSHLTGTATHKTQGASFPQALLFILASALLMLMTVALEPGIALPLIAFLVMAALTRLLGQRIFGDLAEASGRTM